MCIPGATRTYFEEGKTGPIASWVSAQEKGVHDRMFAPENGAIRAG